MLALELNFEDGASRHFEAPLPISVGRGADCDLRLKSWRVGRYHARIERRPAGVFIDDLGTLGGTFVNGHRIAQYGPLQPADEIIIGPCLLKLINPVPRRHQGESASGAPSECPDSGWESGGARTYAASDVSHPHYDTAPLISAHALNARPAGVKVGPAETSGDACADVARPCERSAHDGTLAVAGDVPSLAPGALPVVLPPGYTRHCRRLHGELLEALDLRRRDIAALSDSALRSEASDILADLLARDADIPPEWNREQLIRTVVDEAVGLGPLEPLLADPQVSEIMVNRHDEIFVETSGRLRRHPGGFSSEQAVLGVIERIVSPLGRRIDDSSPMVDARLRDGSRVNAVIPPIALRGASMTIRKFPTRRPNMAALLGVGSLSVSISQFLALCVTQRKNVIVSGGTGSGKTTLLNVLSGCIPAHERVVTIEDAAELQLDHEHLVSLEARPANLEGKGAIHIRDLVRNALRMRPDRIVVGECRGAEAFDMLAAMNTGHEGSLTTLHANSPRDALNRLETMVLMAGMDLPLTAVREHVSASVDIIVQQARLAQGPRVITSVVQLTGQESGQIQLQELFRFDPGPPPAFIGCGIVPDGFRLEGSDLGIDAFNACSPAAIAPDRWHGRPEAS